jgi:hypothetical protein
MQNEDLVHCLQESRRSVVRSLEGLEESWSTGGPDVTSG